MSYVRYFICRGCGFKTDSVDLDLMYKTENVHVCDACHKEIDGPVVTCASPIETWKHVRAMGDPPTLNRAGSIYHYHPECVKRLLDTPEAINE